MELQIIDASNPRWSETLQQLRHDFYHLPAYVVLEAQRIQAIAEAVLIQDGEKQLFLPYLLRQCDDLFPEDRQSASLFDLISPYGYPGFLWNAAAAADPEFIGLAICQLIQTWQDRNICSAFLRLHPILNQGFEQIYRSPSEIICSETVAIDLRQPDAEIWRQIRSGHRTKINKCQRTGFTASIVPFYEKMDAFIDIYTETMNRVGASPSYYFRSDYFLQLMEALLEKLHLCVVEIDQQIACAGLFTECCGIVQYHLGGTSSQFLKQSPSALMFSDVCGWAKARGNQFLHLGGGVGGAKDSLHHFKAGFSQQYYYFPLLRLVLNQEKYHYLATLQAKRLGVQPEQLLQSTFFPAYRSPASHS